MGTTMRRIFLDGTRTFRPGDPRPEGYIDWMAWAEAQHRAGIGQARCRACRLYQFPQELAVPEGAAGGPLCHDCSPATTAAAASGAGCGSTATPDEAEQFFR